MTLLDVVVWWGYFYIEIEGHKDELYVRDDNYNISISCVRYLNQYKEKGQKLTVFKREFIPG